MAHGSKSQETLKHRKLVLLFADFIGMNMDLGSGADVQTVKSNMSKSAGAENQ